MEDTFLDNLNPYLTYNTLLGMEIPPVSGMYAVKLWALDIHLYNSIKYADKYLFNVPYLKFINGKNAEKKDTKDMIEKILEYFKADGYEVIQELVDKKKKPRKLTSNECDSFLYATRMFIKYHYENQIQNGIAMDIIELNDRFIEEKETIIGKKLKEEN